MKYLFSLLLAFFRNHDFDYENAQCINQSSLDKDVTGEVKILLYFVVFCKHCGKALQTDRETYAKPSLWQRWFCVHNSKAAKIQLDNVRARAAEIMRMTPDEYSWLNKALENELDIRSLNKEARTKIQQALKLRLMYTDKRDEKPNE